jgi:hypothetical protein
MKSVVHVDGVQGTWQASPHGHRSVEEASGIKAAAEGDPNPTDIMEVGKGADQLLWIVDRHTTPLGARRLPELEYRRLQGDVRDATP